MRFLRHVGIYRSDVSSLLFTPGACPAFRSGRCQGIGQAGKNLPCPSSAMSSGRLFLDRVARLHCPSPLRRQGHHILWTNWSKGIIIEPQAVGYLVVSRLGSTPARQFIAFTNSRAEPKKVNPH